MSNLVQYVDVCIANEEDADKVLGIKAPNNNVESGKLNKSGYEYVAREICKRFQYITLIPETYLYILYLPVFVYMFPACEEGYG